MLHYLPPRRTQTHRGGGATISTRHGQDALGPWRSRAGRRSSSDRPGRFLPPPIAHAVPAWRKFRRIKSRGRSAGPGVSLMSPYEVTFQKVDSLPSQDGPGHAVLATRDAGNGLQGRVDFRRMRKCRPAARRLNSSVTALVAGEAVSFRADDRADRPHCVVSLAHRARRLPAHLRIRARGSSYGDESGASRCARSSRTHWRSLGR